MKTCILCFKDFKTDIDTIEEHRNIINQKGSVWWGWWKQRGEIHQKKELLTYTRQLPCYVWLVDRMKGKERYFKARCMEIKIPSPRGNHTRSPQKENTPKYYRNTSHGAWFRFETMEPVSSDDFNHHCERQPSGSDSLYWAHFSDGAAKMIDSNVDLWPRKPCDGNTILHLSDLHFSGNRDSNDHGYPTKDNHGGPDNKSLCSIICNRLEESDASIGVIVVSGDLITKGDNNGYSPAKIFLKNLTTRLGLTPEHVVIVPGNHDIWVTKDSPETDGSHEEGYKTFIESFYGKSLVPFTRIQRYQLRDEWEVNFVTLNSAHLRSEAYMEYGYVGSHHYKHILTNIREGLPIGDTWELPAKKHLNFAILHHHILPATLLEKSAGDAKRPISVTLDAGELVQNLQESKFHFVLHGHQHLPFIGSTSRVRKENIHDSGCIWHNEPLYILGCGSSGAKVERLQDELRQNCYSLYTPNECGLHILIETYNSSCCPSPYMELTIPFETH